MITLNQLRLLQLNAPDLLINKYVKKYDFFYVFLTHLQELSLEHRLTFQVLEPLFEGDFNRSQSTTIRVNNEEELEFYIMLDEYNNDITLFLANKQEISYHFFLENTDYREIRIEDYMSYLNQFIHQTSKKEHT